jgi:lipoate-protein ligase A
MAEDDRLFEEFLSNTDTLPLLKICRVNEPGVTVGYSYKTKKEPGSFWGCFLQKGARLLRNEQICIRPTGGGLVEHGNDLIYSVIARRESYPAFHQVRTSYLSFHEAVQEALLSLGFATQLMRCDDPRVRKGMAGRVPSQRRTNSCFTDPVATDVLYRDQKIAGGAQRRKGSNFLHQGSIQLLNGVPYEDLKSALSKAFQKKFSIVWEESKAGYSLTKSLS